MRLLLSILCFRNVIFFFFNDTATTEIYTLSLHDALPIWDGWFSKAIRKRAAPGDARLPPKRRDRKSTRLNSSHSQISYAVFCLKKKISPRPRREKISWKTSKADRNLLRFLLTCTFSASSA